MKRFVSALLAVLLSLSLLLPAAQGTDAEPNYTEKLSADLIEYIISETTFLAPELLYSQEKHFPIRFSNKNPACTAKTRL